MKNMEKLAVDIDGVLANFLQAFLDFFNALKGTGYKEYHICHWEFSKCFGITKEEERRLLDNFYASGKLKQLTCLPYAKEAIKELSKIYEIYALTSRHNSLYSDTIFWIRTHFPEIKDVFFLDKTRNSKEIICREIGIKILVEDNKDFAFKAAQNGIFVLLMDKPYNKGLEHDNIKRVEDWKAAKRLLIELQKHKALKSIKII
ncbi:MAG: NIF family HAD-type phosphatase [Candidatus Anstonellales archaeon]